VGIRKQATFTEDEFERAAIVARYENHTFSRFIVHCVKKETDRRYSDAMGKLYKKADKIDCRPLPAPGNELYDSIEDLENEILAIKQKVADFLAKERLPDDLS